MIPNKVPYFYHTDLLPPGSQYREKERFSVVGWLKHLFLFSFDAEEILISEEDRKDYKNAIDTFKKANGLNNKESLHDWEDNAQNDAKKQAKSLNKCMKALGYKYYENY